MTQTSLNIDLLLEALAERVAARAAGPELEISQ